MDENKASPDPTPQPAKKRTRASVACNFCRLKRSKAWRQLQRSFVHFHSRRAMLKLQQESPPISTEEHRSTSRVQVEALAERVKVLESLLKLSAKPSDTLSPKSQFLFNPPSDLIPSPKAPHTVQTARAYQSYTLGPIQTYVDWSFSPAHWSVGRILTFPRAPAPRGCVPRSPWHSPTLAGCV
ncbi:hypothetical protein FE257_004854 [Aspergillus nanangensis]|uniref:Uncharacterized protein n=1 Tax=Aspergillus nanangensis TaxID=2582783 RepID=A0AAD4GP37_ASPNN|nr:hypothetical protein FE257_004854 [Aspergillus nanangensis]